MLHNILNLIFPPRCIFCRHILSVSSRVDICNDCFKKIPFTDKMHISAEHGSCYDELICVCRYSGILKDALIKFKFYNKPGFYRALGVLLSKKIKEMTISSDFDIIIGVPLHNRKKRERGYNQSELISRVLSREIGIPVVSGLLKRIRDTQPQSLLPRHKRHLNVKGAFCLKEADKVADKAVLLVDDVLTTGSTLNECARVLKNAGAKKVTAAVIASGRNR